MLIFPFYHFSFVIVLFQSVATYMHDSSSWKRYVYVLKARLHRRFLSRQLHAIFVAFKLQLQNRTCKPGAIFSVAAISQGFRTCLKLDTT